MLWLALHFPLLPLEALPLRQPPSAVVTRGRIVVADPAAMAAGVASGQKLSTALGLQPGLQVVERDSEREARAVHDLACAAGRFTPTVSVTPSGLLLEIGGCLRLFGGLPALLTAVLDACRAQGWSVSSGLAPTPLAARWLAQGGGDAAMQASDWQAAWAALPLAVTGWSGEILGRLSSFGLQRLGDLAGLPTAALRQRIGNAAVDDWLRARGELPDPQPPFVFPEVFNAKCELPSRVEHAEALVFAGQRLIAALAGWLQVRQAGVRACTLHLTHDDRQQSTLILRLAEATADEGRLLRLLREHLGRLQLSGPVEALALSADELVEQRPASASLFAEAVAGEGTAACLERLRARLGEAAVTIPGWQADHRPACADRPQALLAVLPAGGTSTANFSAPRPLWLLPAPQALAERQGGPYWQGLLQLLTRGERLEAGWWDEGEGEGDQRRDYFIASTPQGQVLWIYRDAAGWFLHGFFA